MIKDVLRTASFVLIWLGLIVLFVLSPAIGSISSILAVAVTVLLSPFAFHRGAWNEIRSEPALLIFLAAFVSIAICYQATAQHPGDILFAANFLALLLAPVIYFVATRFAGGRTIAIVAGLFAASSIVALLMGSYDVFVEHKGRAVGIAQGGNLMARTVVLLGFMGMAGIFVAPRSRWWGYILGFVFAILTLFLTQTRGVFIAVPVLGGILVWALWRQFGRREGVIAAIGIAIITAAEVFLPRFLGLGVLFLQLTDGSVTDIAVSQRLYMWNAGLHTFLKSPLIGFGWANFTEASLPYGIYFYHNDFFDMAVAAGVVGIVCWIAIIAAPILGVLAMQRDRYRVMRLYCALILSASLAIFGITDMTLGYDLPTTLYAFLTAIILGAFREPGRQLGTQ